MRQNKNPAAGSDSLRIDQASGQARDGSQPLMHGAMPRPEIVQNDLLATALIDNSEKNRRPNGSKLCLGQKVGSFAALRYYSRWRSCWRRDGRRLRPRNGMSTSITP